MSKLNFDKLIKVVSIGETIEENLVFNENGKLEPIDIQAIYNSITRNDDSELDTTTFKDLKKMGINIDIKVVHSLEDGGTDYFFDKSSGVINIFSDNFTFRDCIIIIDLVKEHLKLNRRKELFVSFGNQNDETHTLYHGESTAYGLWWNDFCELFMERINGENKLESVTISIEDYQTDDERFYTKDRVIDITLE